MDTNELYDAYRNDVVDTARPYLWLDEEVWRYMADAHRMYFRLLGGIADFLTDEVCRVECPAGQAIVELHPSVLRVMQARRLSDNAPVTVVNQTDLPLLTEVDYGRQREIFMDDRPGPVKYMVTGMKRSVARLVMTPQVDEQLALTVYRTPIDIADGPDKELTELDEEHHIHLLDWMKHLAYKKQDAETFDRAKSEECGANFRAYVAQCKAEWERYKHKTRVVEYGGL